MSSGVGLDELPTIAKGAVGFAAFSARAWTADGSENEPLTRCPGAFELVSTVLSSASPADEMTFAVELAL